MSKCIIKAPQMDPDEIMVKIKKKDLDLLQKSQPKPQAQTLTPKFPAGVIVFLSLYIVILVFESIEMYYSQHKLGDFLDFLFPNVNSNQWNIAVIICLIFEIIYCTITLFAYRNITKYIIIKLLCIITDIVLSVLLITSNIVLYINWDKAFLSIQNILVVCMVIILCGTIVDILELAKLFNLRKMKTNLVEKV